ncbi:MAG: hypothetical protein RL189_3188 [Pseudomonadota bacterium]|jgi:glutathione peroxidase
MTTTETAFDFTVRSIDGSEVDFSAYKGKVLLIVNVASRCGFTPQYKGLEALYRKFSTRGFHVLGFPCNQFALQEPGDENEIRNFCSLKYDVTFPLFSKINVNGPDAHPLYVFLKNQERGIFGTKSIKWNFTKFLVGKDGQVIRRYGPNTPPDKLEEDIIAALEM